MMRNGRDPELARTPHEIWMNAPNYRGEGIQVCLQATGFSFSLLPAPVDPRMRRGTAHRLARASARTASGPWVAASRTSPRAWPGQRSCKNHTATASSATARGKSWTVNHLCDGGPHMLSFLKPSLAPLILRL